MSTAKELLVREIENLPLPYLQEVLDFIQFLKAKHVKGSLEPALLSEAVLGKDWLQPQEDEAWREL